MNRRRAHTYVGLLVATSLLLASCAPAAPSEQKAAPAATAAGAPEKPAAAPAATPKPAATAGAPAPLPPGADPQIFGGTPVYGGILTASARDNPATFDMHQQSTTIMMAVASGAYNTLLTWDHIDHSKMLPDLAKKWEVSPDGLTYTFYLEEGVTWHDGTPFTAEDVRYSIMREKNPPKNVYIFARATFDAVETVEVVDKYTARVRMNRPSASFLMMMTLVNNSILPKHVLEQKVDMKNDIMGTGPWKLKNFISGVSMEFVKNPEYFKKGLPYMDGRTVYIIADTSSRLAAFRTGRVLMDAQDHEPPAIDTIEATMKDVAFAWRIPGMTIAEPVHCTDKAAVQRRPRSPGFFSGDGQVGIREGHSARFLRRGRIFASGWAVGHS